MQNILLLFATGNIFFLVLEHRKFQQRERAGSQPVKTRKVKFRRSHHFNSKSNDKKIKLTGFCFATTKFFKKCNEERSKGVQLSNDEEVDDKGRNTDNPWPTWISPSLLMYLEPLQTHFFWISCFQHNHCSVSHNTDVQQKMSFQWNIASFWLRTYSWNSRPNVLAWNSNRQRRLSALAVQVLRVLSRDPDRFGKFPCKQDLVIPPNTWKSLSKDSSLVIFEKIESLLRF